ncbi:MAG: hypothetical protein H6Q67_212 [Firmicutes bacterium]|nr:hypothetical protein [Bacillota bacterium]
MTKPVELSKETEELSQLLDILNSGTFQESDKDEITELLSVADLIKKAELPAPAPKHLIEQTTMQVLEGMPSTRPRRHVKAWLYSGAFGVAASVMLLISINLLPVWTHHSNQVTPPATALSPSAPPETSVPSQSPLVSSAIPANSEPKEPIENASSNIVKTETPRDTQTLPSPPASPGITPQTEQYELTNTAPPSPEVKEQVPAAFSAHVPPRHWSAVPPRSQKPVSVPVALSLPGQLADSTVIDSDTSTIRQIFYKGTPQEVIITQRALMKTNPLGKAAKDTDETSEGVFNKITVIIFNQEVTIEGRESKQQLLIIAHSLTP